MDEDEQNERFLKLGFKPQKENVYNKLLPYADKLDEESTKLFYDIKTNLIKSVLAREMRPGCALWTSRLNKYMKIYGLKFSKEDHLALIKLFYDLLTIPDLEPTRINKFATTLTHLLKKRYLLSQEDLQLEWRPLYELYKRLAEKGKTDIGMFRYSSTLEVTLDNLIRVCRIYFSPSVTQEILDEFRPKLCPFNAADMTNAIEYLELFLPIVVSREQADVAYNLWFEEFMSLWEVCHNSNSWENNMACLMARLSGYNIGYINWEPYIPIMFVRFLRTLHLPVCYRQKTSGKQHKIDTSAMTLWIVSILSSKSETGFIHLEKFMQALESYFHPANTGRWTIKICDLLRKLAYYFVQRLYTERYKTPSWEVQIPDDFKLRDEDVDRFVNIMKPCVELAIFAKHGTRDISLTLQYLASMRPNIIVPVTLEKLFASMDSLTEPHKLTSSMLGVMSVARYLVQGAQNNYPEGPTHVIPLLMALLPGIDPNDIRKCFTTFNFIVYFVNLAPLVNSSEASKYYDDLTEEEHIVCEATAGVEDFVLQLFDRLLSWVESNSLEFTRLEQPSSENNKKNRTEDLAEAALVSVINVVLGQCSPEIFTSALRKVYVFATERILETRISGKMVAAICQCFTRINPDETMRLFVPHLCDTIEQLLGENDDVVKEEIINDELLYNMCLLTEMVDARSELVNYMDRLNRILERTLHMNSLKGSAMAAHMLELIMLSLTFTQPTEYRSCNKPYSTPINEFLTVRHWGVPAKIDDLNISWYLPGEKEINCVQMLLNKYLVPELEKLDNYSTGQITLTREELRRTLRIIVAIMDSQTVLPQWDEPALQLVESSLKPWAFQLIVGGPYTVTMPDGRNVRKVVADTIHRIQKKLLDTDEGDTKCFHLIIHIYDILMFNKFRGRNFEFHWKHFHLLKKLLEDRLHQKKLHLRHVLIDRVMLHQEFRNESRSCSFTETHKQILLDLFELGISRYGEVRGSAQIKLFATVSYFPYSYTVLTPYIKETLQLDTSEHHEKYKGCLYILLGPKNTPIVARHDWSFVRNLWPLLVKAKPSEKPSIISLINSLTDAIHRYFPTIAINLVIPEKCLMSAHNFARNVPQVTFDDFQDVINNSEKSLQSVCEQKHKDYCAAIDSLLEAALSGNLQWRYHHMTLSLINVLVHRDVKYNAKVVKYFLNALINDSIKVRNIALKVVLYILIQNKPKFKKITIDPLSTNHLADNKLLPGIRPDNQWLLYNSKTVPTNAVEWEKPRFVNKSYVGFYTWPKNMQVYAPSYEQPTANKRMDNLTDEENEIYMFFNDKENVALLIKYFSMEDKKELDKFNAYRFLMFKNYFKLFEDTSLDIIFPHLEELVKDTQEQSHRCATEIISGLIRGSNHWSFEQVEKLWSRLIPVPLTAFGNLSSETVVDWGLCIGMGLQSRDPNRHHWILEFLIDNPLGEQTSFISSSRLFLLHSAISQQSWRNAELIHRLLEYLQNHLMHPFQNVREKISSCLAMIFCKDFVFPCGNITNCPRIEDFFKSVLPKLDNLYKYTLMQLDASSKNDEVMDVEENCDNLKLVSIHNEKDKEDVIRLFKIVARYITTSVVRVTYSVVPEFLELLPLTCVLQSNDVDDEIPAICTNLLAVLAQSLILDCHIPAALSAVKKVADCPFWSARAAITEFIPVLVFHNLATLISREEWVLEVQTIVLQLLEDVQPEVRISASKVLSGLLHCKFILKPIELLEQFKVKAKTKLKRRDLNKSAESTTTNNSVLTLRHAGVLGLCAFINAHPYDVPDFLPDLFRQLGPHLNDPQPIPATIRKTLGDFKRTHLDNWEGHKLKFTEEELSVLSDLTVPPSYYA